MSLDDREVCLCFHVTRRKLQNFIRVERPKLASQLSNCFGAGTGCGWCRPLLVKIFEQSQSDEHPSSRSSIEDSTGTPHIRKSQGRPAEQSALSQIPGWDDLTEEQYAARRAQYIADGKGKPPT